MMCYTLYLRRFLVLVGYLLVGSIVPLMPSLTNACGSGTDEDEKNLQNLLNLDKKFDQLFYADFKTSGGDEFINSLNGLWDNFGNVVPLKKGSDDDVCGCKISSQCVSDPYHGYLCYSKSKDNTTSNYICNGICAVNSIICDPDFSALITTIGNQPTYFEANTLKYLWNSIGHFADYPSNRDYIKKVQLINFPQDKDGEDNGYIWSWDISKNWPTGDYLHYDGNAKYILAVYRYLMWTDGFDILNACVNNPDNKTCRTVLQKIMWAMLYQLNNLNGKSGLLETPGGEEHQPVDYWDNYIVGYRSASLNIYFYASLRAMAAIKRKLQERGELPDGKSLEAAKSFLDTDYDSLAEQVKKRFNEVFWDSNSDKERYISSEDRNGTKVDFGMTFLQFEAMYYGLVDNEFVDVNKTKTKASSIYDWLDGKRSINSDIKNFFEYDSFGNKINVSKGTTGSNIYKYGFAPVSNTVPIEREMNAPTDSGYWWYDINSGVRVGRGKTSREYCSWVNGDEECLPPNASYGTHLENGGAIFYTSFYDIMARFKYLGANDAHKRMTAITNEYGKDKLVRDPGSLLPGAVGRDKIIDTWKFGIIGEFPESGLVPTVFLYGYMGIDAKEDGLNIRPKFPRDMTWGKVNEVIYHDNTLSIEVYVDPDDEGGKVKTVNIDVKAVNSNPPKFIDLVVGTRYPNEIFSITNKVTGKVRHIKTDGEGVLRVKKLEPLSTIIEKTEPCSNESCPQEEHATYDGKTLTIPFIDIPQFDNGNPTGEMLSYQVSLDFNNVNGQRRFLYNNGQPVQPPNSTCRNATYSYPDGTVTLPCVDYYEFGIIPICRYSDPIPVYSATLLQPDLNELSFTLVEASLKNVHSTYTYCEDKLDY
ncbi:MAG: hypothetical protein HC877_18020 [Thioploca sp.]|nr:hypothetical protein [Thioploca sp.]